MSILKDKIALVTGSSRGIGAAVAGLFAQEGAKVVVHGRDAVALSSVQAEIERAGGEAMQVAADITKFAWAGGHPGRKRRSKPGHARPIGRDQ